MKLENVEDVKRCLGERDSLLKHIEEVKRFYALYMGVVKKRSRLRDPDEDEEPQQDEERQQEEGPTRRRLKISWLGLNTQLILFHPFFSPDLFFDSYIENLNEGLKTIEEKIASL